MIRYGCGACGKNWGTPFSRLLRWNHWRRPCTTLPGWRGSPRFIKDSQPRRNDP